MPDAQCIYSETNLSVAVDDEDESLSSSCFVRIRESMLKTEPRNLAFALRSQLARHVEAVQDGSLKTLFYAVGGFCSARRQALLKATP